MQKTAASPDKSRPALLLAVSIAGAIIYAFACFVVFRGAWDLNHAKQPPLSPDLVTRSPQHIPSHRADFYRIVGDRLQYYPHDPNQVSALYRAAVRKGPADYHNFFEYAYYLSSRNCCPEVVRDSLNESIRRAPTNPEILRIAATYYLATGDKLEATLCFRRALELESVGAQTLFSLFEQHGNDLNALQQLTPAQPDAMIQLCQYLKNRGAFGQNEFRSCVVRLARLKLDAQQQLSVADLAAQAGLEEIALRYSKAAAGSREARLNAYRLLADQAWKSQKLNDYDRYSSLMEKTCLEQGLIDQAAEYALAAALRYDQRSRAEAIDKVLQVLKRYPRFAEAYSQMAALSQDQSDQLTLFYLKKAVELAPFKIGYSNQLANYYVKTLDFKNAESTYQTMLSNPDGQETGYLGLAACKEKEGDRFQAIIILEDALSKGLRTERVLTALANLRLSIGDHENTLRLAKELMILEPNNPGPHLLAAEALLNLGRYSEAREHYQLVLASEPNNQLALQELSRLKTLGY